MKWWKRLLFSVISLVLGFCSLDYLFYAYRLLAAVKGAGQSYTPKGDGLYQLLGGVLFCLWFLVIGFYWYVIQRASNRIDFVEGDAKTGKEKVKRKWFDVILQGGLLLTGLLLRWAYLVCVVFPKM